MTAVPTKSLQTMVTAGQTQPEAPTLSEQVLIYNLVLKYSLSLCS